jgi:hypothetical protein
MDNNIRLAFYIGSGNFIDKVIRLVTGWGTGIPVLKRPSHVELIIGDVWHTSSGLEDGVVIRELVHKDKNWDFLDIEVDTEHLEVIKKYFEGRKGLPYDYKAILLSQAIPVHKEDPDKYFCSEIIADVLNQVGIIPIEKKPAEYSPADYYKHVTKFILVKEHFRKVKLCKK